MFNKDFFPTPEAVILQMIEGYDVSGKTILEPSAGKGNIVDVLLSHGAQVIACEKNEDLQKIVASKCRVIASDFLTVTSTQVSHVDFIMMNPPFSDGAAHILHAWEIAPAGCKIIALCNLNTIKYHHNELRERFKSIIEENGRYEDLGQCFSQSERKTGVEVALVHLQKPANGYEQEFSGFFFDEDQEEQGIGLMPYNAIRDIVNRYISAVKLYDQQLELSKQMTPLIDIFPSYCDSNGKDEPLGCLAFDIADLPRHRAEFKTGLQKRGWKFIFDKMNMNKYSTQGLREDINKFVEKQTNVPFTMKNIYAMLQLVIGTTGQRMDKALLEVFNKLTEHYDENRYHVEGWKTNSHYLVNRRFIFPYGAEHYKWNTYVSLRYTTYEGKIGDLEKALCYLMGDNYDTIKGIRSIPHDLTPGQWYDSHFFRIRAYKKGTIHCEFLNEDTWARFNQQIARIKGYPLYEGVKKSAKAQEKQNKKDLKQRREYGKTKVQA